MANEKIESIVTAIEGLTLLELKELVTAIEEKFGVSGAIMVGGPAVGGAAALRREARRRLLRHHAGIYRGDQNGA